MITILIAGTGAGTGQNRVKQGRDRADRDAGESRCREGPHRRSGATGYHNGVPDRPRQNPDQPTPAGILTRPDESAPRDSAPEGDIPFSREELERWYAQELLSLQRIADRAAARLGTPVSRAKAREWLLAAGIPRRSLAQAARLRARRRRAGPEGLSRDGDSTRPEQLQLFADAEGPG